MRHMTCRIRSGRNKVRQPQPRMQEIRLLLSDHCADRGDHPCSLPRLSIVAREVKKAAFRGKPLPRMNIALTPQHAYPDIHSTFRERPHRSNRQILRSARSKIINDVQYAHWSVGSLIAQGSSVVRRFPTGLMTVSVDAINSCCARVSGWTDENGCTSDIYLPVGPRGGRTR